MTTRRRINILVIAFAHDYPTKERPVAGPFIKEFVEQIGSNYNCNVMLVKRIFIDFISFRSNLKNFWKAIKFLIFMKFSKKKIVQNSSYEHMNESILSVNYPVFQIYGIRLYIFDGICATVVAQIVLKKSGFKPDIIQTFKSFPPAYIGLKLKKKYHIPVVNIEYQGPFSSYFEEPYCMRRALNAIRNIDRTVYTKFQINIIRSYGIPEDKLGHGHFGVDTNKFKFDEERYSKRKNEVLKNKIKLLVIGRVEEEKGLKYLIESIAILVKEYPDIQLSIVGPKGNCFEWLIENIKLLDIEKNVQYLGIIQRKDLAGVINDHDIIIIASFIETLGMTMLEALSCGKPVVATKCGGPEEFITKNNGILVPARDASALAQGISQVINNYYKYNPNKISEYVLKNYSYYAVGKKFHNLYEELSLKN